MIQTYPLADNVLPGHARPARDGRGNRPGAGSSFCDVGSLCCLSKNIAVLPRSAALGRPLASQGRPSETSWPTPRRPTSARGSRRLATPPSSGPTRPTPSQRRCSGGAAAGSGGAGRGRAAAGEGDGSRAIVGGSKPSRKSGAPQVLAHRKSNGGRLSCWPG